MATERTPIDKAVAHLEEANDVIAVALRQWHEWADDPPPQPIGEDGNLELITSTPIVEPLAVVGSLSKLINRALGNLDAMGDQ